SAGAGTYRAGINDVLLAAMRRGVKARLAADVDRRTTCSWPAGAKFVRCGAWTDNARFIIVDRDSILGSSFKRRSRFAARARRPCGRTARTSSRSISSSSRSRGPPELWPGVGSRSSADHSVIERENDERLGKRISSPWAMRSPEGKELSTRMVGLALLAMALVTAAFAVTVARADEGAGTQWNAVLAGINERPTPRDTHARGVAVFELSADGDSMHYKVIAANINNVIMAHIHLGDANTAGPVIVWLYPIGGPPPAAPGGGRFNGVLAQGDFDATKFVGPMAGKPMSALVENLTAGTAYVNIHTDDGVAPPNTGPGDFPGGEIRGQVKPTDGRARRSQRSRSLGRAPAFTISPQRPASSRSHPESYGSQGPGLPFVVRRPKYRCGR